MALTSQVTFDITAQTQSISFFEGATLVDQISYGSNTLTFAQISSFNLSKSDLLLYYKYLLSYFNALFVNLISLQGIINPVWPLCQFDITISSSGVTHLIYTQNTGSSNVYTINYTPIAVAASFAARANPVAITVQEFQMTLNMFTQYSNQVSFN